MSWLKHAVRNPIGAKAIMAVTGIMLTGFLVAHISGNLLIFAGPQAINAYAEGLRKFPAVLWVARGGLLAAFVAHLYFAAYVTLGNRAARPQPYAFNNTVQATWASRHMVLTGLVMLAFIIFHLAHFTWRVTDPEIRAMGEFDVYQMAIHGFRQPAVAGSYLIAMAAIGLHLSHGIASIFQTLGLNHPRYNRSVRFVGPLLGVGIALLFASIPLSIYLGLVK
jgi:succinate dehydrogenase / fumarate reductase cytochrome b subunit